ncbi:MAG: hypothetical protein LBP79_01275 [Clostridiales bacterium]|jgi:hypothetical protein|nr:hypothetical protein [Clostridiales bacterium]
MATLNINLPKRRQKITIDNDANRYIEVDLSDTRLLLRLNEIEGKITEIAEKLPDGNAGAKETVKAVEEAEKAVCEQLDYALGTQASAVVFADVSPLSVSGGKSIAQIFLEQLAPIIKAAVEKEYKGIEKHAGKYIRPSGNGNDRRTGFRD